MLVAGVQHDTRWEDPAANQSLLTPRIARAADAGARLVLLTEMFATGFSMDTARTAEPYDGPTVEFLVEQSAARGLWLGGSLAEHAPGAAPDARPYNRFVLAGPDGSVHRYAKIHPFSYGREDEHFAAGDEMITILVDGVRVTPVVCYDLRFANVFWDAAPTTDLYTVVANWPVVRQDHWTSLLHARAIENQAYVFGVNRCGAGGGLAYGGGSMLIDPFGACLATAGDHEEVLIGDVDPGRVSEVRAKYPFLIDRR